MTLWEENIEQDKSYSLIVKEYASAKFLSMAKVGSQILPIPNIGEIVHSSDDADREPTFLMFK